MSVLIPRVRSSNGGSFRYPSLSVPPTRKTAKSKTFLATFFFQRWKVVVVVRRRWLFEFRMAGFGEVDPLYFRRASRLEFRSSLARKTLLIRVICLL